MNLLSLCIPCTIIVTVQIDDSDDNDDSVDSNDKDISIHIAPSIKLKSLDMWWSILE